LNPKYQSHWTAFLVLLASETAVTANCKDPNMRMLRKLWKDKGGQDLIEYALLIAFFATAVGGLSPSVAVSISTMWRGVTSVMTSAGS
jgi:Flp pilus assembly pilin Flp